MIPALRKEFNKNVSAEKYEAFLKDLDNAHPGAIEFRVAETPVFVPKDFTAKMLDACENIVDVIADDNFKSLAKYLKDNNVLKVLIMKYNFTVCVGCDVEVEVKR